MYICIRTHVCTYVYVVSSYVHSLFPHDPEPQWEGGRGRLPPLPPLRLCCTLYCTRTQCATYDIFAVFVLLAGFCTVLPRPHHPSPQPPPGMAWSHLIEKLSFNCREERQKQVEREGKQQNKNLPLAFVYNSSSIVPRTKVGKEHGNWQWRRHRLRLRLRRVLCVVWLRDACPVIAPNGFSIASTRLALPCLELDRHMHPPQHPLPPFISTGKHTPKQKRTQRRIAVETQ